MINNCFVAKKFILSYDCFIDPIVSKLIFLQNILKQPKLDTEVTLSGDLENLL